MVQQPDGKITIDPDIPRESGRRKAPAASAPPLPQPAVAPGTDWTQAAPGYEAYGPGTSTTFPTDPHTHHSDYSHSGYSGQGPVESLYEYPEYRVNAIPSYSLTPAPPSGQACVTTSTQPPTYGMPQNVASFNPTGMPYGAGSRQYQGASASQQPSGQRRQGQGRRGGGRS